MMIKKKSNFPLVDCRTTTHSETTCSFELLSLLFFMVVSVAVSVCPPGRLALSRGGRRRSSRSFPATPPPSRTVAVRRHQSRFVVTWERNVPFSKLRTYLAAERASRERVNERVSERLRITHPVPERPTERPLPHLTRTAGLSRCALNV